MLVKNSKVLLYHIQVVLKEGIDYSLVIKIRWSYFTLKEKENPTLLRALFTCFIVIQPVRAEFTYPLFHSGFIHVNLEKTHR